MNYQIARIRAYVGILLLAVTVAVLAFMGGSSYYHYSPFYQPATRAVAVVRPTRGNTVMGVVMFNQQKDGVHIRTLMTGLTPGKHGFHIHELGDCSSADGTSAGDHFNPTRCVHGAPDSHDRHAGDLGNLNADESGEAIYHTIDNRITLNGHHSIIGRSVIVHEQEDDLTTQPTGNAGARIACGVIGRGA